MAGRKMKTRHGLIAMLRPAIVLHPGIGLVCDLDFENVACHQVFSGKALI
jgi:hypothetical protein